MTDTLVWDDIRAFLAVARVGTLSGAAGHMGLGLATVSRRIERLEVAIGQPLFLRQQSGYRLTDDGTALVERAEEMEAAALSLTSGLRQDAVVSGTVRLATAENLATGLILPELARLRAEYPQLTLEIVTDIATVNLHRRDADIALRMVKPERGNVTLQRLGTLGYGLYGAPGYVAARREAMGARAFDADDFIGWSETHANLPAAQWIERMLKGRAPAITTTSLATQIAACVSGFGLAILPHFLAKPRDLTCLDADLGIDQSIWLVTQSDLAQSRRVRLVADFLRDLVKQHGAALSG
ncbi:LysR family transcriptional regulator [uncultured Ruegeria sp.]|uniref:LysR family transcriptional regulator n=1 Tax=uncultured Ruegeria sp. TaxID=259304 RepID=UPI0026091C40|nr:LysR family transcriptional regulator [uncultured Ruegeria sp.]